MKAKSNLKAVENQGNMYQYNEEQMTCISEHLYFVKSVLAVIADMDGNSPGAFEKGDVQNLALEGRIRVNDALELLQP